MIDSRDLVSIVVNCHNSEKFVEECINSIIQQSYKNFEIIVWDNNSTDRTKEIISQLSITEKRIKFYKGESFLTLGSARNHALLKCSGDWIAFLDSDDLWDYNFLSDQISALKNIKNEFFGFGHVTIFNSKELPLIRNKNIERSVSVKSNIFHSLLRGNFIYFSSLVISRSALTYVEKFNDLLVQAEDYELLLRLTQKYQALQTGHAYYRIHANNTSKKQNESLYVETLEILNNYMKYRPAKIAFANCVLRYFIFSVKSKSILKYYGNIRQYNYIYLYFCIGLAFYFYSIPKKIFRRIITFRISCFPKV